MSVAPVRLREQASCMSLGSIIRTFCSWKVRVIVRNELRSWKRPAVGSLRTFSAIIESSKQMEMKPREHSRSSEEGIKDRKMQLHNGVGSQ